MARGIAIASDESAEAPAARPPPSISSALKLRLDPRERRALEDKVNRLPVVRATGTTVAVFENGIVEARLKRIRRYHLGGGETGFVNGPVILGLLDCVLAVAGLAHLNGGRCATVELTVKLMQPVLPKDVHALGYVVSRSRSLLFAQGEVYDARDRPKAMATGIIMAL
jgi:uncharacterized protein (TIGR00369 family)